MVDCNRRGIAGHQFIAWRPCAGVFRRCLRGQRGCAGRIWHSLDLRRRAIYFSCYTCCVSCAPPSLSVRICLGDFSQPCRHCARPKSGSRPGYGCDRVVSCRRPGSLRLCRPLGSRARAPGRAVVILVPVLRGIGGPRITKDNSKTSAWMITDERKSDDSAPH